MRDLALPVVDSVAAEAVPASAHAQPQRDRTLDSSSRQSASLSAHPVADPVGGGTSKNRGVVFTLVEHGESWSRI
jgi:hypothetical protein